MISAPGRGRPFQLIFSAGTLLAVIHLQSGDLHQSATSLSSPEPTLFVVVAVLSPRIPVQYPQPVFYSALASVSVERKIQQKDTEITHLHDDCMRQSVVACMLWLCFRGLAAL
jgi:hypothetical protein